MIYIVDGTGPFNAAEYARAMQNSFCSQIDREVGRRTSARTSSPPRSIYSRGPTLEGGATGLLAEEAARCITSSHRKGEPIYLCGYSRGGAAVIHAAALARDVPVKAMFLFDAVDRTLDPLMTAWIPRNVRMVYYARRDPRFSEEAKQAIEASRHVMQKATLAPRKNPLRAAFLGGDPVQDARAREAINAHAVASAPHRLRVVAGRDSGLTNFGNCGLRHSAPTDVRTERFLGSHGALGGVPWPDIQGDAAASASVKAWMWNWLRIEGVFDQ